MDAPEFRGEIRALILLMPRHRESAPIIDVELAAELA
jgi:hypothetical protein